MSKDNLRVSEKDKAAFLATITIDEIELSVRAYDACRRAGITNLDDLLNKSPTELLQKLKFRAKTVREIQGILFANRERWGIAEDHPMIAGYPQVVARSRTRMKRNGRKRVKIGRLPDIVQNLAKLVKDLQALEPTEISQLVSDQLPEANLMLLVMDLNVAAQDLQKIHWLLQSGESRD
jgi:hypothetical protein